QIDPTTELKEVMPFRDLPLLLAPLYDYFRGLPQVDFSTSWPQFASACVPNGRIDHDVIQSKNSDRVSLRDPWDCSFFGYAHFAGVCASRRLRRRWKLPYRRGLHEL